MLYYTLVCILLKYLFFFQGIERSTASILLSIIGITNTVGRVACGWIADFPSVNSLFLNNMSLVVSTIAVTATPFCHTFEAYVVMAVFFGLAICKFYYCFSSLISEIFGLYLFCVFLFYFITLP